MAIKLHTCGNTFVHGPHPCWQVMKALNETGVEYEQVKEPSFGRSRRTWVIEHTGQNMLPVIEFEDGTVLREEAKDLAAKIRAGELRMAPSAPSAESAAPSAGSAAPSAESSAPSAESSV